MANYEDNAKILLQSLYGISAAAKEIEDKKFRRDMEKFATQLGIMRDSLTDSGFSDEVADQIIVTILNGSFGK